jgi:pyrroloquinoline quinone biosynthesis protein B
VSPVPVHALSAVPRAVEEGLRIPDILTNYCGFQWITPSFHLEPLLGREGTETGLDYKAVQIKGLGPRYFRGYAGSCRSFYLLRESGTGRSVLIAPAVAQLEPEILAWLNPADVLLFDGTFWSNEDFTKSGIESFSAAELLESHLPILNGSLQTLAAQRAKHKVYIHVNNTNRFSGVRAPSAGCWRKSGIKVAMDAMRIEL